MTDVAKPELKKLDNVLDGLVERTKLDAGAPFTSEVLQALADLQTDDIAEYMRLRERLKKDAKCPISALDRAVKQLTGDEGSRTQADILVRLAAEATLFHTPDERGYADIAVGEHRETHAIRSSSFRRWLGRQFYSEIGGAATGDAMAQACAVLEGKAFYEGEEREAHLRVGGHNGKIYIDLADTEWRAVEIDAKGWRVIEKPPVRFYRKPGMLALPEPVKGGKLSDLRPFLNIDDERDFTLLVAWIVAALRDVGPYPVLVFSGEQGSAKTFTTELVRRLIDPSTVPTRSMPGADRDLFIAANNSRALVFDNLSYISPEMSDALCRMATGGGFATRALYTDNEEALFSAWRPTILNGIADIVMRPDLADRSIFLHLSAIYDDARRREEDIEREFAEKLPAILGALFDAVSTGLRRLPSIKLDKLPRMADFAVWATACETAFAKPGSFMSAYSENRADAAMGMVANNLVADALLKLIKPDQPWTGSATQLLNSLAALADRDLSRERRWPKDAARLSGALRKMAATLRQVGIWIDFPKTSGNDRDLTIEFRGDPSVPNEAPLAPLAPSITKTNDLGRGATDAPAPRSPSRKGLSPSRKGLEGATLLSAPPRNALKQKAKGDQGAQGARNRTERSPEKKAKRGAAYEPPL